MLGGLDGRGGRRDGLDRPDRDSPPRDRGIETVDTLPAVVFRTESSPGDIARDERERGQTREGTGEKQSRTSKRYHEIQDSTREMIAISIQGVKTGMLRESEVLMLMLLMLVCFRLSDSRWGMPL